MRDESVERVSRSHKTHIPVEGINTPTQATEPKATELTHFSEATASEEMVTRCTLTVDQLLPDARLAAQSQQPLGKDWTPPSPSSRAKKK